MNTITLTPQILSELGLSSQQIAEAYEKAVPTNTKDPYTHQKKYIQKKRATDAAYADICRLKKREQNRWKYQNDPEYRSRLLEKSRQRYIQKK